MDKNEILIDIRDLKKYYPVHGGVFKKHIADVKALDGVNLKIKKVSVLAWSVSPDAGRQLLEKQF